MADRNTPAAATFEEWRVEFNELATDVGDIAVLPSTIGGNNVTDVYQSMVRLGTWSGLIRDSNSNVVPISKISSNK